MMNATGPLAGVRVVEMAGIGPAPFCGMLLADMGADVIRIERRSAGSSAYLDFGAADILNRGKRALAMDLKNPLAVEAVLRMLESSDVLIEGFRPGVMERLGLGPTACMDRNSALVYGRITGWGQTGRLAQAAGHDINYISLSGVLASIGTAEQPLPPLNLVGDLGGGAMLLAFGIACALAETRHSGRGQVIDAAMTDGAALLMAMTYTFHATGQWKARGENWPDGTCSPFYTTYACADDKWISIGALEPQFYALMLSLTGASNEDPGAQWDTDDWPARRERLATLFRTRTQQQWCQLLEGTDACFAPVLELEEAPMHPHNRDRGTYLEIDGITQPAPAPRFSRTPASIRPAHRGGTREILEDLGLGDEYDRLISAGACAG